jgi:hypothetical protein
MIVKTFSALVLALLAAGATDPLLSLLPGDGTPPGWQRRGETRIFVGAELYRHIDGGAELYHRSGFDRLAVQDYARGPAEVRVEIYAMNDPAGAEAVFAELGSGLPGDTTFGQACTRDDYQIQFRRDRYLVSLTCYEPGAETKQAMGALAAAIDASLQKSGT